MAFEDILTNTWGQRETKTDNIEVGASANCPENVRRVVLAGKRTNAIFKKLSDMAQGTIILNDEQVALVLALLDRNRSKWDGCQSVESLVKRRLRLKQDKKLTYNFRMFLETIESSDSMEAILSQASGVDRRVLERFPFILERALNEEIKAQVSVSIPVLASTALQRWAEDATIGVIDSQRCANLQSLVEMVRYTCDSCGFQHKAQLTQAREILLYAGCMGAAAVIYHARENNPALEGLTVNPMIAHTLAMFNRLSDGDIEPDFCVLSDAQLAYMGQGRRLKAYEAIFPMPPIKAQFLAPKTCEITTQRRGLSLHLVDEKQAISRMVLDRLIHSKKVDGKSLSRNSLQPSDGLELIKSAESASLGRDDAFAIVTYSIQASIAKLLGFGVPLWVDSSPMAVSHSFLMCHKKVNSLDRRMISMLFHDSWERLRSSSVVCAAMAKAMSRNKDYCQAAHRVSGMSGIGLRID